MKHLLPVLLLSFLLLSCENENKKAEAILARVALTVEQNPDSALSLLDSIEIPNRLPKPLYMEYELRRIQARDKAYKNIAEDTVISSVAEYFVQKNDVKKMALATFYCGRVYQMQKSYKKATKAYLQANDYAEEVGNENLLGLIDINLGSLHYNQMLIEEAINYYRKSYQHFSQTTIKYQNRINALRAIGNCFWVNQQLDSALTYYNEGLRLAELHNDDKLQSKIYQSIGVSFQKKGDLKKGHTYFEKALHLSTGSASHLWLYRNLANSFLTMGRQDSALFYANQMLQHLDSTSSAISFANAYSLLAGIEESSKNYRKSLEYYKLYIAKLAIDTEEVINNSVLEVQKRYNMEKIQNNHNKQIIKYLWVAIGWLIAFMLQLAAIFILYRRKELHRNRLHEANNMIYALRELGNHKDRSFKKTLLREFNIVNEVQLLGAYLSADARKQGKEVIQKVNQIVAGHSGLDWSRLYRMCNLQYDGLLERLKKSFLTLDELQLKICCLTLEELNNDQQAFVLQRSKGYIQNNKSAIRKIIKADAQCDLREALLKLKDIIK